MSLHQQLKHLEQNGLVYPLLQSSDDEYLFHHALIQEVAYESLLKEERRRLHLAVGRVIERLYPERTEELAATLAYHFDEAEAAEALHYWMLAGDAAFQQYAIPEAIIAYSAALKRAELATRPFNWVQLTQRLGRAYELRSDYAAALALYSAMEQRGRDTHDRALVLLAVLEQAKIHAVPHHTHDPQRALELAEHALHVATILHDQPSQARAYWCIQLARFFSNDLARSLEAGNTALELARSLDLREQMAYVLHDLQRAYRFTTQTDHADTLLWEAISLWRSLGNWPMLADALCAASNTMNTRGENTQALAFAEEALHYAQLSHNGWTESYARMMIADIYTQYGFVDQARDYYDQAYALSSRHGPLIVQAYSLIGKVRLLLLLGATEQVRADMEHFDFSVYSELLERFLEYYPQIVEARVAFEEGNLEQASIMLDTIKLRIAESGFVVRYVQIEQQRMAVQFALHQGDWQQALELLDQDLVNDDVVTQLQHQLLWAHAYVLKGSFDQAEAILEPMRRNLLANQNAFTLLSALLAFSRMCLEQQPGSAGP